MNDKSVTSKYPNGLDASDVLTEIRAKHGDDAFALCSILDVCDEMAALFGRGSLMDLDVPEEVFFMLDDRRGLQDLFQAVSAPIGVPPTMQVTTHGGVKYRITVERL